MIFYTLPEMSCEPDCVANLKKYFNDLHNTGTYYKKIASKERKWCVSIVTYKTGCRFSSLISLPMVMNNLSPMIFCQYSKALTCWGELRNGCRKIVGVWSSSKRKTFHLTLCRPDWPSSDSFWMMDFLGLVTCHTHFLIFILIQIYTTCEGPVTK